MFLLEVVFTFCLGEESSCLVFDISFNSIIGASFGLQSTRLAELCLDSGAFRGSIVFCSRSLIRARGSMVLPDFLKSSWCYFLFDFLLSSLNKLFLSLWGVLWIVGGLSTLVGCMIKGLNSLDLAI